MAENDIDVYDLANRMAAGQHVSQKGQREVAEELIRLKSASDRAANFIGAAAAVLGWKVSRADD